MSPKWVTTFNVNYTDDFINWNQLSSQAVIFVYYVCILIHFMIGFFCWDICPTKSDLSQSQCSNERYTFTIIFRYWETKMLTMMQPYGISRVAKQQKLYGLFH